MSSKEEALSRIEVTLGQICQRLESLEKKVAAPAAGARKIKRKDLISFLDQFRAAEALGEASLGAWLAVCQTDCVRGGLRTIQQREGMHARLLEARMKELGASPTFEIPDAIYQQTIEGAGDASKADAQKVKEFVAQFPDCDAAIQPIFDIADQLDHDQETQFLLRTIAQDEKSTLTFLHDACALLNG